MRSKKRIKHDQAFVDHCDRLLRAGKAREAASQLMSIEIRHLADDARITIAQLCRRAGLVHFALKIMTPRFRDTSSIRPPSPGETAEMAILLQRAGSIDEALKLLVSLNGKLTIEKHLYTSHCLFARWQYAEAIPHLKAYLESLSQNEYRRDVANVNLAAALIFTSQYPEALEILEQVLHKAKAESSNRLFANALELRAQIRIREKKFKLASNDLDLAEALLHGEGVHDQTFIQLWRAVVKANLTGNIDDLTAVQTLATSRRHWESAREGDLQILLFTGEEVLLQHLYFGTPHPAYRSRMARELGANLNLGTEFKWEVGKGGPAIDLIRGTLGSGGDAEFSRLAAALLRCLASDLYRPQSIGSLFSQVFRGEYFDIFSSPGRIYKLVSRTRQAIATAKLPLEIRNSRGLYSIELTGPGCIITTINTDAYQLNGYLLKILHHFGVERLFTNVELQAALGLKKSQINELLSCGEQTGVVERVGRGAGTSYCIRRTLSSAS